MGKRIPGKEIDRFYCTFCGFPIWADRESSGDYGSSGWNFATSTTTGSNLITNGGFTADTSSWTAIDCSLASVAGGQSGNCLEITLTGGSLQYAYQAMTSLEFGVLYGMEVYVKTGSSGDEAYAIEVRDSSRARVIQQKTGTTSSSWTKAERLLWRSFQGDNVVCLVKSSNTAGTMLFDTVTLYEYIYSVIDKPSGCPLCGSKNWKN